MNPEFAKKYYRLEDAHPWSVGRRDVIARLLEAGGVPHDARILEVGCGSGALVRSLVDKGFAHVTGLDLSELAIEHARSRGLDDVLVMDAANTQFDDASFDVIIASDVLEHIMDEQGALAEWMRLLVPGGLLVCFVPAFAFLWSEHDVANLHFRRYSRSMLESCVVNAGYRVERIGYWNAWLFAPMTAMRAARRVIARKRELKRKDDFDEFDPTLAKLFGAIFRAENKVLAAGLDFPVGVSVYALLRTPTEA